MKSCENCRYRAIDEDCLPCSACIDLGSDLSGWVGTTNADSIRAMTDEELAEWVTLMVCKYRSCGNCPMSDWCSPGRGIAEWLKSPVEVEE